MYDSEQISQLYTNILIFFCRIYDDYVITGGLECRVKVWKIKNNNLELLHNLKGHTMAVVSIAVSPKGLGKGYVNSKNRGKYHRLDTDSIVLFIILVLQVYCARYIEIFTTLSINTDII